MTHRAARRGGTIPRIWLLPLVCLTALLGAAAAGTLSRSLLADLIAWWPAWLLILILAVVARGRRIGKVRAPGLIPLLAAAALGVFLLGHLEGWPLMPSASQRLVGPLPEAGASASLTARLDGALVLAAGSDFLYEAAPVRLGGDIGMPQAAEETQGGAIAVVLSPSPTPGFNTFSGWDIRLSEAVPWDLTLEGAVAADLRGLDVASLAVHGEGTVALASAEGLTPVAVDGDFAFTAPEGVAARVVGDAEAPASWERTGDGWRSPATGPGWVITAADGATVVVTGS